MKEALFYKKLENNLVQCELCPHKCVIKDGNRGICRVRKNRKGVLYSLVYGRLCSTSAEPIEKKPLYHFLPGSLAYSIATVGCNLKCKHCQNYEISQAKPEDVPTLSFNPKDIVKNAIKGGCKSIAYTFTEPTVFYEVALEISKLAKKNNIKNIIVSNGFINPIPLKELCKHIDAANIDLKSINDKFYKDICEARVEPILEALKILKKEGVWLEITNLLIPTLNNSEKEIKNLIKWIKKNLGTKVPLHFTAFYPCYELLSLPPTPAETLKKARKIALQEGLKYVYTGNVQDDEGNNTFCPKCKKMLIKRRLFSVIENNLKQNRCKYCDEKIDGVFA